MTRESIKKFFTAHYRVIITFITLIVFAAAAAAFTIVEAVTKPSALPSVAESSASLGGTNSLPIYKETADDGSEYYAVSVADITDVNTVTAFNYNDDEFTDVGYVTNTGTGRAKSGTIKIIVKNLDPYDEDFEEKAAGLGRFSDGNYWNITLYIPAVFSSCNIYVGYNLAAQIGTIEGYDFSAFCDKTLVTSEHSSKTEPVYLTVPLKNNVNYLTGDTFTDGCVITIHYETTASVRGILGDVLIGEDSAVRAVVSNDSTVHFPLAAAGILVFAMFVFICLLKHTANFMPPLLLAFGIFLFQSACYAVTVTCTAPVFIMAFLFASIGVIALSAVLCCKVKIKKLDARIPLGILAGGCIVMGALTPYYATTILLYVSKVMYLVLDVCVIAAQIYGALHGARVLSTVTATATAVMLTFMVFDNNLINFYSPSNWLCFMLIVLIIAIGFNEFVKLEKASRNYTRNLQQEVAAQTNSLQAVINEREDMLRFVTHDMRKPVNAMNKFLETLSQRERDEENLKTVRILQDKTQELGRSLDELARYSRINYIAEDSARIDAADITDKVYNLINPDCVANGILFDYKPAHIEIWAKQKSLESILSNLIINAIEHADCTTIALSAVKRKDKCVIYVTDDGKGSGIESGADMFEPYNNDDNEHGLGLYICRKYAESMNGTIAVERTGGKTIFIVTLPLM